MDKICKNCSFPLKGKQKLWCSDLCKRNYRYSNDPEYRERNNTSRTERMRAQRDENRRQDERMILIQALYLAQFKLNQSK